jgi:hypothetical protein
MAAVRDAALVGVAAGCFACVEAGVFVSGCEAPCSVMQFGAPSYYRSTRSVNNRSGNKNSDSKLPRPSNPHPFPAASVLQLLLYPPLYSHQPRALLLLPHPLIHVPTTQTHPGGPYAYLLGPAAAHELDFVGEDDHFRARERVLFEADRAARVAAKAAADEHELSVHRGKSVSVTDKVGGEWGDGRGAGWAVACALGVCPRRQAGGGGEGQPAVHCVCCVGRRRRGGKTGCVCVSRASVRVPARAAPASGSAVPRPHCVCGFVWTRRVDTLSPSPRTLSRVCVLPALALPPFFSPRTGPASLNCVSQAAQRVPCCACRGSRANLCAPCRVAGQLNAGFREAEEQLARARRHFDEAMRSMEADFKTLVRAPGAPCARTHDVLPPCHACAHTTFTCTKSTLRVQALPARALARAHTRMHMHMNVRTLDPSLARANAHACALCMRIPKCIHIHASTAT